MAPTKLAKKAAKKVAAKAAAKMAAKAAKKAPAKVASKAAKKAAKKSAKPDGHDLRRAYEHMHRVALLHGGVPEDEAAQIEGLTQMAQGYLASEPKAAADLLRACEHLAFGARAARQGDVPDDPVLAEAIEAEYAHLVERARQHWEERGQAGPRGLNQIFKAVLGEAKAARKAGALPRALEMARAAEALSHVEGGPARLGRGRPEPRRLPA